MSEFDSSVESSNSVDVSTTRLCELIEAQNTILTHQNTILSNLVDELMKIRFELINIRGNL